MELKELPKCPVETTLALIGEKWKILIIRDLLNGTKRFGELKKVCSGISQKVLTTNLRSMEDAGLVTRKVFPQVPPRVEYSLTPRAHSFLPLVENIINWAKENMEEIIADRVKNA